MTDSRTIQLGQFMREAIEARLADVNVSLPCSVVSYDAAKQTVTLQPTLKRRRRKKDGTFEATTIPTIQNVPVAFPRCAGGWITFPLAEGDVGMAVFSQRSLGEWSGKTAGQVVDPSDEQLHPFNGAWFYPGGWPAASPLAGGADAANPVFHTATFLDLGQKGLTADDLAAVGKLVDDRLAAVYTHALAHVHPSNGSPATPTVPPLPTTPASTKATKVRIK